MDDAIPLSIRRKMDSMLLAKWYNQTTGSSITHRDVEQWGFVEAAELQYALSFIGKL